MHGKHSIVTSKATIRRRLKISATTFVPALLVAASLGIASGQTDADLQHEIECGVPSAQITDSSKPCGAEETPAEEAPAEEAPAEEPADADGETAAAGESEAHEASGDAGAAAAGTSDTSTGQPEAGGAGSDVVDDPKGFASNLSCELMERFDMAGEECNTAK